MPIRTQLLKKWVGPDPEKHIGSTPLHLTNLPTGQVTASEVSSLNEWQRLLQLRMWNFDFVVGMSVTLSVGKLTHWQLECWRLDLLPLCACVECACHNMYACIFDAVDEYCHCIELWCGYASFLMLSFWGDIWVFTSWLYITHCSLGGVEWVEID